MKINQYNPSKPMSDGFYSGVPDDVYKNMVGVSKSTIKRIARSPAHYAHFVDKRDKRSVEIINALKCAVFSPEHFNDKYIKLPEVNDRRCGEYKAAARNFGSEFVLVGDEVANITNMAKCISEHPIISKLKGTENVVILSSDPESGVLCYSKIDFLADDGTALIIKITSDARREEFSNQILRGGYHIDAAFISDQCQWIHGKMINVKFVAVEEKSPHSVFVYNIDDGSIIIGRDGFSDLGIAGYKQCLKTYVKCIENDEWPGYSGSGEEQLIGLPDYYLSRIELANNEDIL